VDQCLRLTVDVRAGQQTRMKETSAGSSLRAKPASDRQLVDDVKLSVDIAWCTASERHAIRHVNGQAVQLVNE